LSQGAKTLGYPYISHGLFPRGGAELIDYFLEESRRKMTHEILDKMDG
jgi:ubiquinone biosynthesis protein COQ9